MSDKQRCQSKMPSKKSRSPRTRRPSQAASLVIPKPASGAALAAAQALVDQALSFSEASTSKRTREAYASQIRVFEAFCAEHGLRSLPASPSTLALYLTHRATSGTKPATLSVANAAIAAQHRAAGVAEADLPLKNARCAAVWRGIRRTLGVAPRRVEPVLVDELRAMVGALPETLGGARDRALLLIGFCIAARRSELVDLQVDHVRFSKAGLVVRIARSKTDQEGAGVEVGVPYGTDPSTCPIAALRAWLSVSRVRSGHLFRSVKHGKVGGALSGRDVARIVQRTAAAVGIDPRTVAAHSLRAGLATAAASQGKSDRAIMQQGRWKNRSTVDAYVRSAQLLDDTNAASGLGL